MKIKKLIIVGEWKWEHYERSFSTALSQIGIDVRPLKISRFFKGPLGRYQKVIPFPFLQMWALNYSIINEVRRYSPDCVIFWRPTHVFPFVLTLLKRLNIYTVSYNNDDPFGPVMHGNVPWHHHFLWVWYIKSLKNYNANLFYREINVLESIKYGAKNCKVLMPYFVPWKDCPISLSLNDRLRFETDMVFVGHYENDGRLVVIQKLLDSGCKLKLWGGKEWNDHKLGIGYECLYPVLPAIGDDYIKALTGAKVCLAFLSKLNRDTYTRRCFEIPACGCVMLAERTNDLTSLFKEDEEACFYSSIEELMHKSRWLIENPSIRNKIALAGQRRVWMDHHDVNSRALEFVSFISAVASSENS